MTEKTIYEFLKNRTALFGLIPDDPLKMPYQTSLIKGAVQSGKSRIIHALSLLFYSQNHSVLILLRNYTNDYEQFHRGMTDFLQEARDFTGTNARSNVFYLGNLKRVKNSILHQERLMDDSPHSILIGLANHEQISKLNRCLDIQKKKLIIIIDEVDQICFSSGRQLNCELDHLIQNYAEHLFGISATLYGPLHVPRFELHTSQIYNLRAPKDYKGINDIRFHFINSSKENLLNDADLDLFLRSNRTHEPFSSEHPMIALIKTERLISNQDTLLRSIANRYPEYCIITYNGTCCRLYASKLRSSPCIRIAKKRSKLDNDIHSFRGVSIAHVLQYLKSNGGSAQFPRIIIISFKLIGRGINIVSADFGWHLTHMFYRPSRTSDATTMIQSMRLCGVYRDEIPLRCYMTRKDYDNIYKGYMLQEDIFSRLKDQDEAFSAWFGKKKFYKDKIPSIPVFKNKKFCGMIAKKESEDDGMSMAEFKIDIGPDHPDVIDGVDLHRLKKWMTGTSLVGRMIRFLMKQDSPISLDEFKDGVGYDGSDKMFKSNVDNGCGVRTRFGRLWRCKNNKIIMNDQIVQHLN